MNQEQMYWKANRTNADINIAFMEMLASDNPITKRELRRLIERRPELWGRFSSYLSTNALPE